MNVETDIVDERKLRSFLPGDLVLVRCPLKENKWQKGTRQSMLFS